MVRLFLLCFCMLFIVGLVRAGLGVHLSKSLCSYANISVSLLKLRPCTRQPFVHFLAKSFLDSHLLYELSIAGPASLIHTFLV